MTKPDAIYPLTPLQEGMLFHALQNPGSDHYIEQLEWRYRQAIDPDHLRQAWQAVIDIHEVLRTCFVWRNVSQPLQVVMPGVDVPWCYQDWRHLGEQAQNGAWQDWLKADREKGFDLAKPGAQRLLVARMRDDEYACCWTCHHIVMDGWSGSLILQDLDKAYLAITQGRGMPDLSRPKFGAYVSWLQRQNTEQAKTYWRHHLAAFETPTFFANTRSGYLPGAVPTVKRLGRQRLLLPEAVTSALEMLSRHHRASLNSLVQLAWAHLLAIHNRERCITYGTTLSGRTYPLVGIEEMVGLFLNTVPVCFEWREEMSLSAALQRMQRHIYEAQDYGFIGLPELQRLAGNRNSLFSSLLVFENYADGGDAESNRLERRDVKHHDKTHYPLTLLVHPGKQLGFTLAYDEAAFGPESIAQLSEHFAFILSQFAAHSDATLGELCELPPSQRQAMTSWQGAKRAFPAHATLGELLAAQACSTPEHIAVIAESQKLSYRDLHRRADRLAAGLQRAYERVHGAPLPAGTPVGVYIEPGIDLVVTLVGVIKAGAAYVPLSRESPAQRNRAMLQDSEAALVACKGSQREEVASFAPCPPYDVDLADDKVVDIPSAVSAASDDLAYIIYTSGSTGKPKGVMVEHRALVNRLDWMQQAFELEAGDKVLQKTPSIFDVSVWEFFWPLLQGATLVVTRPDGHKDPGYLYDLIDRQGITHLHFVPSMARAFCSALEHKMPLTSVKQVYLSGEALPTDLTRSLYRLFTRADIFNLYGPTEAAIDVSVFPCSPRDSAYGATTPIGKPIQNTRLFVLSDSLRLQPIGVPGQLYIAGEGLARGYVNQEEFTRERFIENPFKKDGFGRLYRTGDLVRWLPDGELEFIGRLDSQVKLRGFRIELGEVEAVIARQSAVHQALVLLDQEREQLLAYVVPRRANKLDTSQLRTALAQELPGYMIPAHFIVMDELPLTATGKVDRHALPAPEKRVLPAAAPAMGAMETRLAPLWQEVLKVDRVDPEDDFFALGGHSLLAIRLVSRMNATLGSDLSVKNLFDHSSLTRLADYIERETVSRAASSVTALPRVDRSQAQPLSAAQTRFWILHQTQGERQVAYNVPNVLVLAGKLDPTCLEVALSRLVCRHAGLRTRFVLEGGTPMQRIEPNASLAINRIDADAATLNQVLESEALYPFELDIAPLGRASLIRLARDKHVFCLTLHHIISDGWSTDHLLKALFALYDEVLTGHEADLPPVELEYVDYAAYEAQTLAPQWADQLAYWQQQSLSIPALRLPADHPRPSVLSLRGARLPLHVPKALAEALVAVAKANQTTPFCVLLSAYYILLHRYTGQDQLCVGTSVATRQNRAFDHTVGPFINILPLRVDLSPAASSKALLARVSDCVRQSFLHQDVPFQHILDHSGGARTPSHTPLFQTMFVLQSYREVETIQATQLEITPKAFVFPVSRFEVTIDLHEAQDGFRGDIEYSTDLFSETSIGQFRDHYLAVLQRLVSEPHVSIGLLNIQTDKERQQIRQWQGISQPVEGQTLTECFALRVSQTPNAPALSFAGRTLSYAELDVRTNNLARRLLACYRTSYGCPMPPQTVIAVNMERGIAWIVSLVAILKAGGAYLPISRDTPRDRATYMLDDARAAFLLTEAAADIELAGEHPCPVLSVSDADSPPPAADDDLPRFTEAHHLAYVIYTSGTTGRPKGVMVEHRNGLNYLHFLQNYLNVGPGIRVDCSSNIAFDFTFTTSLGALLLGHHIHLCDEATRLNIPAYLTYLREHRIDVIKLSPKLFSLIAHYVRVNPVPLSLGHIILGGEAINYTDVRSWLDQYGDTTLYDEYGPTETTVGCSSYRLQADQCLPAGSGTRIGRPGPNIRFEVLDGHLQPCPIGVPGELFIGGDSLARGYLGQPVLTAERFIHLNRDDAGAAHPEACRFYRTGDRVRWLPHGEIEYLGRLDDQIKLRGYRVQLGEVEHALVALPEIRQAVVRHDLDADRLVAYVATSQKTDLTPALKQALATQLPHYMIPSRIVQLASLPLTVNGKIDHDALPAPTDEVVPDTAREIGHLSPIEVKLRTIWQELLDREDVGIDDNFFDLGGNSLKMIRALPMVIKLFDIKHDQFSIVTLFSHPTISSLARWFNQFHTGGARTSRVQRQAHSSLDQRRRRRPQ